MALTVTTYNVKFPDPGAPYSWEQRRPLVAAQLARLDPDLLCVQEAYFGQVRDLQRDAVRRTDWVGLGRDGGSRGEYCAVLYDADRLEPLAYDHFWLSDTPDAVGSRTPSWGNHGNCRMATWVRFRDRREEREFAVLNTHLDESSARARLWGAELIAARLHVFEPELPVLVCGDFNTGAARSDAYTALTARAGLRDAWLEAHGTEPAHGTFNDWAEPEPGGDRIDWILLRGPAAVTGAVLGDHREGAVWPSDHLPVAATVAWEPAP